MAHISEDLMFLHTAAAPCSMDDGLWVKALGCDEGCVRACASCGAALLGAWGKSRRQRRRAVGAVLLAFHAAAVKQRESMPDFQVRRAPLRSAIITGRRCDYSCSIDGDHMFHLLHL